MEPLKEIITATFNDMNADKLQMAVKHQKDVDALDAKLDRLEERFVFEEITSSQYGKFKSKMEQEKHKIQEQLAKSSFNGSNLRKSVDIALKYALNLPSLWERGNIETKRSIQNMVFPDGLGYDFKNKRVQTFRVNSIFASIASMSRALPQNKNGNYHSLNDNSRLVTSTGFKPVTS